MKLSILIAAFSMLYSCSTGIPESKVPSVVYNAVKSNFPDAIDIDWEKSKNDYEAEFVINGIEHDVYVDSTGKLILYKRDIKAEEFPSVLTEKISMDYSGYKIDDVAIIEKDSVIYYLAELESKGKKDLRLVFSADGTLTNEFINLN